MNKPIVGLRVAGLIFGLSCLLQIGRLVVRLEMHIGDYRLGIWGSAFGIFISGAMALWMWRLADKAARPTLPAAGG